MTCKDCYHCSVCCGHDEEKANREHPPAEKCRDFKDKSRIVEMPCKVGDSVYKIDSYPWSSECGECEHFMPDGFGDPCECMKTDDGRKAPECRTIQEYEFELRDILNAIGWGDFGKKVFLTRKEAEEALRKEREK